jgi:hypothetical protein
MPWERVMFWRARDANPFFHLYESLWMIAGRNDVAGVARYAKQMQAYSDDGKIFHGAYGHRWRNSWDPMDQLDVIVEKLRNNPDDRRCVLQMWDAGTDLEYTGKDVPCNLMATFQRDKDGKLDLTVFCRSNDIIWGAYGANAVHFSFLQEYMASRIRCGVGHLYQVSVNWHAYHQMADGKTLDELNTQIEFESRVQTPGNPYDIKEVRHVPIPTYTDNSKIDRRIGSLLAHADAGFSSPHFDYVMGDTEWIAMVYKMLYAHHLYKTLPPPDRYERAREELRKVPGAEDVDWLVAGDQWLVRRQARWEQRVVEGEVKNV